MAVTIESGQYEVILRKKYLNEDINIKVPNKTRLVPGRPDKDPTKTYGTLLLNMEFRKDIIANKEIAGERIEAQLPFIKTINTDDGTTISVNLPFIKSFYAAVGATSDFTPNDFSEFIINKPVLITLNVNPQGWNNRPEYTIKKIEKTKVPKVQPSALEDELDTEDQKMSKAELQAKRQEELEMYDVF